MIRQKNLLAFIALLVFSVMTFIDTQFIFIDNEELIESREVEREEELKEGKESKKTDFKHYLTGGSDFISSSWNEEFLPCWQSLTIREGAGASVPALFVVPRYIMFCSLKLHLS